MAFLLVEEWIINEDGYAQANNYRVYFDPNGPMVVIPWDLDSFPLRFDEDGENLAVRVTEAEMEDWREPKRAWRGCATPTRLPRRLERTAARGERRLDGWRVAGAR